MKIYSPPPTRKGNGDGLWLFRNARGQYQLFRCLICESRIKEEILSQVAQSSDFIEALAAGEVSFDVERGN